MRYTPQGIAVCSFTVAVNKRTGKGDQRKDDTTWFKVTVWRERAETASQYIKKGMKILVVGEVKATAYLDKGGQPQATLELTANDFKFLDSKGEGSGGDYESAGARSGGGRQGGSSSGGGEYEDANDIPF
jgi:single-strand DNA-binding protein